MGKIQSYFDPHKLITICARCGRKISKGSDVFSLGVKVKSKINIHDHAGRAIQILLEKSGKTVNAIVPTAGSQAKNEGNDLLFAICSPQCGDALKQALQEELDVVF